MTHRVRNSAESVRPLSRLLSLAAIALFSVALHGQSSATVPTDVVVERDVLVPMRDGISLATDIYRPASGTTPVPDRFPILLHRTPYAMGEGGLERQARYFAGRGYVAVVQNVRGRYKSGGTFFKYDALGVPDAADTIAWLAQRSYSNGQIAMWGTSYGAHTQAEAAKANPPALKALLLNQGGLSNAWDNAVRHGGAFELGRELTWAWGEASAGATDPVLKRYIDGEKVNEWFSALPFSPGLTPLAAAPSYEKYFLDEMTRSDYDDFWRNPGLNWKEYYAQSADVPMLHIGGWYDIWLRTTVDNFTNLARLKKGPVRLLIGPWNHGGNGRTGTGEVEFGPQSAIADFDTAFQLRWFDYVLKNRQTGAQADAPVRLFVMGSGDGHKDDKGRLFHGGYWTNAQQWPPAEALATAFYFHADGSLTTTAPTRAGPPSTTFTFDPAHPVPTIGGNVSGRLKDGGYDQRERPEFLASRPPYLPLRARRDVLVFQTDPLVNDVTIVGPVTVKLFAASSAPDTDFTAKLVDVYPPSADFPRGFDLNLTDGIIRARYRGGRLTQELMKPGEVYEFEVRPFPTANVFKKGHRIRIDISSSNFPRFDVNPNTGEPLGRNRRMTTATNTVYHAAERASHVVLSVMPTATSTNAGRQRE